MKKVIATELEDGNVVELFGCVQWKGYQGDDCQDVGDECEFVGQGLLICSGLICSEI